MRSRLSSVVLPLVAVAGCDVVYGLHDRPPAPIDAAIDTVDGDPCPNDRDCDLVPDSVDNCPEIANSDQDDFDNDDLGDRCDSCLIDRSSSNDDDFDQAKDSVDNCPATSNFDQVDADGDQIGDLCDPRMGPSDSIGCFFAFDDVGDTARIWSLADPWSAQGSKVIHDPASTPPFTISPAPPGMLSMHDAFELRTSVQFSATVTATFQVGIGIGAPASDPGVRCVIDGAYISAQTLTLLDATDAVLVRAAVPTFGFPEQHIAFRIERSGAGTMLTCSVADGSQAPTVITFLGPALADDSNIRLISTTAHAAFSSLTTYRLGP